MTTNIIFRFFKNSFRSKKNKRQQVLSFVDLMIRVDEAEKIEELSEVVDHFEEFQTHYSIVQQRFAKEHFLEKIKYFEERNLKEYERLISTQ